MDNELVDYECRDNTYTMKEYYKHAFATAHFVTINCLNDARVVYIYNKPTALEIIDSVITLH
jgi:hypothetical protein